MSLRTTKVPVGDLRVGMFVCKLDKDWLDTPFLLQGFKIEEEQDIDVICQHCNHVWVDELKSSVVAKGPSSSVGSASFARSDSKIFVHEVPVEEERRRIFGTFRRARALTKSLLDDVRMEGILNTEGARETVNECVKSVIRHPDALQWMSKMRDESEYTAEHSLNVCILAIAFGRQLGMTEQELHNLGMCGLLHDVGKMKVPAEVLNKPGKLNPEEMDMMMEHSIHGRQLLVESAEMFPGVVDVAFTHHEREDGSGYPRQLSGANIGRMAKIISIVDAYDAMTADRCYQQAKTSTEAIKIIYDERGKHFDEALALKFLQTVGLYPPGSIVELHTGEVGIVIESNQRFRQLPRLVMLRDGKKNPLSKQHTVDLALIESGELPREKLIKRVWRDRSFGISLRDHMWKTAG